MRRWGLFSCHSSRHLHYKKFNHGLIFSVWGGNDRETLPKLRYVTDAFRITSPKSLSLSRGRSIRRHKRTAASLMHLRPAPSALWLVRACVEGVGMTAASITQREGSLTSPLPVPSAIRLICDLWNYSGYHITSNQRRIRMCSTHTHAILVIGRKLGIYVIWSVKVSHLLTVHWSNVKKCALAFFSVQKYD